MRRNSTSWNVRRIVKESYHLSCRSPYLLHMIVRVRKAWQKRSLVIFMVTRRSAETGESFGGIEGNKKGKVRRVTKGNRSWGENELEFRNRNFVMYHRLRPEYLYLFFACINKKSHILGLYFFNLFMWIYYRFKADAVHLF